MKYPKKSEADTGRDRCGTYQHQLLPITFWVPGCVYYDWVGGSCITAMIETKNKSEVDTAGRNRGADIGYEPPNLGCLVPPITRKKWTKTCMMQFQSCYKLLSGRYYTICATGIQFLVRTSQIQVLDPPLCKLAAWNFQDICKNIFWEKPKFQCSSNYSFWNIRERNLRGGWNPPLPLIGLSSFSFSDFKAPLWTNTYKLLSLNSFIIADKCRKKLDNCILVVSGNTIIGVLTTWYWSWL